MSDFDYANARLRALKSRLLPRQTLLRLTEAGSVAGLLTALLETAYRTVVETALIRLSGMACLAEALRQDLGRTAGKAPQFFPAASAAKALVWVALRPYTLHNLKTILRGLAHHTPAAEILNSTLPAGELPPAQLAELARAPELRVALDLLATWREPLAQPLLAVRATFTPTSPLPRNPSLDLFRLEVALERGSLAQALQVARQAGAAGQPLLAQLHLEADMTNLLTVLRWLEIPNRQAVLRERLGAADLTALLVGPGRLPWAKLLLLAQAETVPAAIGLLANTPYGAALAAVLPAYTVTPRLSLFERALAQRRLEAAARLIPRDPLGIGVLVGYLALKANEVFNLRLIAQGLLLGEKPEHLRAELLWVS